MCAASHGIHSESRTTEIKALQILLSRGRQSDKNSAVKECCTLIQLKRNSEAEKIKNSKLQGLMGSLNESETIDPIVVLRMIKLISIVCSVVLVKKIQQCQPCCFISTNRVV